VKFASKPFRVFLVMAALIGGRDARPLHKAGCLTL
jgi:hypothetical protein